MANETSPYVDYWLSCEKAQGFRLKPIIKKLKKKNGKSNKRN